MNINSIYSMVNNSNLKTKQNEIDDAIDYLIKEITKLADQLNYSKYKKLVDTAYNLSNKSRTYVYNFSTNSFINEGIFKIYSLLAIYLRISKLLNYNSIIKITTSLGKVNVNDSIIELYLSPNEVKDEPIFNKPYQLKYRPSKNAEWESIYEVIFKGKENSRYRFYYDIETPRIPTNGELIVVPNDKEVDGFDIISKIDDEIESDLDKFDFFLRKPDFIDDKLREVNDYSLEEKNQVYMYNNLTNGLVFEDRKIEHKVDDGKSLKKFQQKKKLYDSMTSYINSETVFKQSNQETIFNFQYLINNYYNRFIQKYIQQYPELDQRLKFIYKGGTTMGIIFEKYNEISSDMFKEDYQEYFKRSDSDYSLQLQADLGKETFNEHYYNMVILNYNLSQKIKKMINSYAEYILPLKEIDNERLIRQKIDDLDKIVNDEENEIFEKVESVIGITVDKSTYMKEDIPSNATFINFNKQADFKDYNSDFDYEEPHDIEELNRIKTLPNSYRSDFYVTKNNNDNPMLVSFGPNNSTPLFFYTNETNYFVRTDKITNFNLGRIKYNFVVYLKMKPQGMFGTTSQYCALNVPAEIADIPVPKYNDFKLSKFNLKEGTKTYKNIRNNNILLYNSYTIISFIEDIYKAIFDEPKLPWLAVKYMKKIERLFFLLEVNLGNRISRKEFDILQKDIRDNIKMDSLSIEFSERGKEILNKTELKNYLERNDKIFCDLTSSGDCKEYAKIVYDKLTNLKYFKFKRNITQLDEEIEEVPYLNKYLKYKNKYLNLKKKFEKNEFNLI